MLCLVKVQTSINTVNDIINYITVFEYIQLHVCVPRIDITMMFYLFHLEIINMNIDCSISMFTCIHKFIL